MMSMNELLKQKEEDLLWVKDFLETRNLNNGPSEIIITKKIGIHEAKINLIQMHKKLNELKFIRNKMEVNCGVFNELEWEEYLITVNNIKKDIENCTHKFNDPQKYEQLKTKLKQRRIKRLSLKNQKIRKKKMEKNILEKRAKLDKEITEWQILKLAENFGKKSKIEENQEINLKLNEVTNNKNEAKKYIEMLMGLKELRRVRNNVSGKGQTQTVEKQFEEKIDSLIGNWCKTLEAHLKKESEIKEKLFSKNAIENKWNRLLFGKPIKQYDNPLLSAEKDFNSLCEIRTGWDNFLADSDDPFASPIPIGWILPNPNPLPEWSKFRF